MQRVAIIILIAFTSCIAQNLTNIVKKNFVLGNKNYDAEKYTEAYESFFRAYQVDSNNTDILYKLAITTLKLKDYYKSNLYFEKYIKLKPTSDPSYYVYHGWVLYKTNQHNSSQELLNFYILRYSNNKTLDSIAYRGLQLSKNSQTLMSKNLPTKKETIVGINTLEYDEYYPIMSANKKKIYFNRKKVGSEKNEIWVYESDMPITESNPYLLPINNIQNKNFVLTSLSYNENKILLVAKDKNGNHDVYESEWMVFEWSMPQLLYSSINSYADEKFATYAHNDSLIYFVSNRADSYGGYDIYKIAYNYRYQHEKAVNLTLAINTEYDEDYIQHVPNTNILFFSSKGHINIGETDIFKAKIEFGQYTRPLNLGYPINTCEVDDIFFPYNNGNLGLIQQENNGSLDIYISYLPPKAKKPGYLREEQFLKDSKIGKIVTVIPKDE